MLHKALLLPMLSSRAGNGYVGHTAGYPSKMFGPPAYRVPRGGIMVTTKTAHTGRELRVNL